MSRTSSGSNRTSSRPVSVWRGTFPSSLVFAPRRLVPLGAALLAISLLAPRLAVAQPASAPGEFAGCAQAPTTPPCADDVEPYAKWHFFRGLSDYCYARFDEARAEFEAAYRYVPTSPDLLYNLAATHFALQDYEAALGWYERYLATGDERYRAAAQTRVNQLEVTPAHVTIFTEPHGDPDDARIMITSESGGPPLIAGRGEKVTLPAGEYQVRVTRPGFRPHDETIHLAIGEQRSYSWQLQPSLGTVIVVPQPTAARVTSLTVDNYVSPVISSQTLGRHHLVLKANGYYESSSDFTVVSDRASTVVRVSLRPLPTSGRWQFVVGSAAEGAAAGWLALRTIEKASRDAQTLSTGLGALIGAAGSFYGSRRGINLGSTLFITGDGAIGLFEGAAVGDTIDGLRHAESSRLIEGAAAGGLLAGYVAGSVLAGDYHPSAGKALLFDSIAGWGVAASILADNALESGAHPIRGPLLLLGTNAGLAAGVLLAPRVDWSPWHVALIDAGGVAGLGMGALAAQLGLDLHLVSSTSARSRFELVGAAAGLLTAIYLFADYDTTTVPDEPDDENEETPSAARVPAHRAIAELGLPTPMMGEDVSPGGRPALRLGMMLGGRF